MNSNLPRDTPKEQLPSLDEAISWRLLMYAFPIGLGWLALYLYPDIESYKKSKVEMLVYGVTLFLPLIVIYDWKWMKKHHPEINRFEPKREWFEKDAG